MKSSVKSSLKPSAKVAIITRTKDRPILLVRAINSVVGQSFKDWVHVIINDGGDKAAVNELVEKQKAKYDGRVHIIHNTKSSGMEAASNKAIEACESEYVVIHDDDDVWHKDFLKKTVAILDDKTIPELGGVICHSQKVMEEIKGKKAKEISREPFNNCVKEVTLWRICGGNLFPPISFLYKRDIYKKIAGDFAGMYNESLPVMGDWDFNIRFLQHSEIAVLAEELAYYHHRVPSKEQNDIYANSIIGGSNKHDFYYTYLRNSLLRQDLKDQKVGIGYLVNLSHDLRTSSEKQDRYKIDEINAIEIMHDLQRDSKDVIIDQILQQGLRTDGKVDAQKFMVKQLYGIFKPLVWVGIKLGIIKI